MTIYGTQYSPAADRANMRLPLRRPPRRSRKRLSPQYPPRLFFGVAAGLSVHLRINVWLCRLIFILTSGMYGAGVFLYLWLLFLVPAGDPYAVARQEERERKGRLARSLDEVAPGINSSDKPGRLAIVILACAAFASAALIVLGGGGVISVAEWVIPACLILSGIAIAWSPMGKWDDASRVRTLGAVGIGLAVQSIGIVLLVVRSEEPLDILRAMLAGIAVLSGVAVVLTPILLRLFKDLGDSRESQARELERADIAAHLHDSVLQTLTLIRNRATDPIQVARLARTQERQLRTWLYDDRRIIGISTVDAIRDELAEVEDLHAIPIEMVAVGDSKPNEMTPLLAAMIREACTNAVIHAAPPVQVYLEISARGIDAFIRDHGAGFELDQIAADRHGVKHSILERARRCGGTASLRRLASGMEVHIFIPLNVANIPTDLGKG